MDPNTCLERFLNALEDADAHEAWDAHLDLTIWLSRGGFEPSDSAGLETFRAFKRLDKYTSVGSYPLLYVRPCGDEYVCAACASAEGLEPFAGDVLWEGDGYECDECGEVVELAYGNTEVADERSEEDVSAGTE